MYIDEIAEFHVPQMLDWTEISSTKDRTPECLSRHPGDPSIFSFGLDQADRAAAIGRSVTSQLFITAWIALVPTMGVSGATYSTGWRTNG